MDLIALLIVENKNMIALQHIKSISLYHELMGLSKPQHPLVSVIQFEDIHFTPSKVPKSICHYFYSIALKRNFKGKLKYGQQHLDFDEGIMHFMAPKQVLTFEGTSETEIEHSGWLLLIHPDFLWNTKLAKTIKQFEFFNYSVNEALHLSEKEEGTVLAILKNIEQEYNTNIDVFSQDVIIAQLELLLTYSVRFYNRQFITRKINNHKILGHLEDLLNEYFSDENIINKGLPNVNLIASKLNVSANYLGSLLKTLTGQSTQQHIHNKLIEKAKEKLSTTDLTVNEIAFALGFEHSQSFSKLFKAKTDVSPTEFRASFN
jgi:AraC-like DNA-binding protein